MNVMELFENVKEYLVKVGWFLFFIEIVFSIAFGATLGAWITNAENIGWVWPLGFGLVYLIIIFVKFSTQKLATPAIIEELKSKNELSIAKEDIARHALIAGFIQQSIDALNLKTCSISSESAEELCSKSICDGFESLLSSLIDKPHYLLNCTQSDFSVFALVYDAHDDKGKIGVERILTKLRDDLDISQFIDYDIAERADVSGVEIEFQSIVKKVLNDNEFVFKTIKINAESATVVASPVPVICDSSQAEGVFLIVTKGKIECSPDLVTTMKIFGQITSNWLSKYYECFEKKIAAKK